MSESRVSQWRRRLLSEAVHRSWYQVRRFGAITPGTTQAERFGSFGTDSLIGFPVTSLFGEPSIHIGRGTLICAGATLSAGYPDQVSPPRQALIIGDRVLIGYRCGLVVHESIEIGDDVWFGQDIYVTDANHGFDDPDLPIGKQLGDHQPVVIGSGSWIGHGAVILPGTRLGRNVVVAAGSVVRGEVPSHSVVAGVPAKLVRQLPESTLPTGDRPPPEPLAKGFGRWS